MELLKANPKHEFSNKQVAEALSVKIQTAVLLLAKLALKKQIEKTGAGGYRFSPHGAAAV